jgi:hypothetical protein
MLGERAGECGPLLPDITLLIQYIGGVWENKMREESGVTAVV